jgi:hypothetical protein
MAERWFARGLTALLLALLLTGGLCLPAAYLQWRQQSLTQGTVIMDKTEVKPYDSTVDVQSRIRNLSQLLGTGVTLQEGELVEQELGLELRDPLTWELSEGEARAYAAGFADALFTVEDTYGVGGQWIERECGLAAFTSDPELSLWVFSYQAVAGTWTETAIILLDSFSGLPVMLGLQTENLYAFDDSWFFDEALWMAVVRQYESAYGLSFGELVYRVDEYDSSIKVQISGDDTTGDSGQATDSTGEVGNTPTSACCTSEEGYFLQFQRTEEETGWWFVSLGVL